VVRTSSSPASSYPRSVHSILCAEDASIQASPALLRTVLQICSISSTILSVSWCPKSNLNPVSLPVVVGAGSEACVSVVCTVIFVEENPLWKQEYAECRTVRVSLRLDHEETREVVRESLCWSVPDSDSDEFGQDSDFVLDIPSFSS
jgi:hypothetical protein